MSHVGPHGETPPFTLRKLAERLRAGPIYEPPSVGPLLDEFAWHLVKYLREDVRLRSAVAFALPDAVFAVDFVVDAPGAGGAPARRVAFECGGSRGPRDHQRQARRDAAVVTSGAVDVLYRLRASDLLNHMEDVLFLVSEWEAAAGAGSPFSERGRINLRTLASPAARLQRLRPGQAGLVVAYAPDEAADGRAERGADRALRHAAGGATPFVLLRRLDRRHPDAWGRPAARGLPAHRGAAPVSLRRAS